MFTTIYKKIAPQNKQMYIECKYHIRLFSGDLETMQMQGKQKTERNKPMA